MECGVQKAQVGLNDDVTFLWIFLGRHFFHRLDGQVPFVVSR